MKSLRKDQIQLGYKYAFEWWKKMYAPNLDPFPWMKSWEEVCSMEIYLHLAV